MLAIGFHTTTGGARSARFGPLTGAAERVAGGNAHRLLGLLARPGEGLVSGAAFDTMPLGDRDRALAALYGALYGADVVADARCTDCAARFELRFDLAALAASRVPDGSASGDPAAVSVNGARLRLPAAADLSGAPGDLVARLLMEGDPPPIEIAEAAIEAADPALELDLSGTCPECGTAQKTPFSMVGFLSAALARDLQFLLREVHLVARAYHWSLESILGLARAERQEFARLVLVDQGERPAARVAAL